MTAWRIWCVLLPITKKKNPKNKNKPKNPQKHPKYININKFKYK